MRKRNNMILVRLLPKERKQLEKLAKKEKTTMSDVIRSRIMNTKIVSTPGEFYIELAEKIHPIGVEINDIAHKANVTGHVSSEEIDRIIELEKRLIEIMKTAKEEIGK